MFPFYFTRINIDETLPLIPFRWLQYRANALYHRCRLIQPTFIYIFTIIHTNCPPTKRTHCLIAFAAFSSVSLSLFLSLSIFHSRQIFTIFIHVLQLMSGYHIASTCCFHHEYFIPNNCCESNIKCLSGQHLNGILFSELTERGWWCSYYSLHTSYFIHIPRNAVHPWRFVILMRVNGRGWNGKWKIWGGRVKVNTARTLYFILAPPAIRQRNSGK